MELVGALPVPGGLTFQDEGHHYFLDGAEVPSVTTVIAQAGLCDWSHCSEWARERGSLVHKALHLALTRGLDWASVDETFHPFISAGLQGLKDISAETMAVEHRVFSRLYGYAGTLDWLGRIDGRLSIIDYKTGPVVPSYGPQTAAYAEAHAEETGERVARRYALRLKFDGTYSIEQFTDRNDIAVFHAALRVATWKREKGLTS